MRINPYSIIIALCTVLFLQLPASQVKAQNVYHDAFSNHDIACFGPRGIGGLSTLHDILTRQVVNSQEVYNQSSFWRNNHGQDGGNDYCDIVRNDRVWTNNQLVACQAGVFACERVGFFGWIVTERWLVPVELIAYTGEVKNSNQRLAQALAVRPARVYDRQQFQLRDVCMERINTLMDGVPVFGLQADQFGARLCGKPVPRRL